MCLEITHALGTFTILGMFYLVRFLSSLHHRISSFSLLSLTKNFYSHLLRVLRDFQLIGLMCDGTSCLGIPVNCFLMQQNRTCLAFSFSFFVHLSDPVLKIISDLKSCQKLFSS
ncbi:hypothetical protein RIF29_07282 [Crotalaria pallida]|uniref:Uncharacterized protein n=1 Tax=Crotalaria pallida TaxID=3830 RepID=A0AAN9PAR6_CROPI